MCTLLSPPPPFNRSSQYSAVCRQSTESAKSTFARLKSGIADGCLTADEVKKAAAVAADSPDRLHDAMVDEARGHLETSKGK